MQGRAARATKRTTSTATAAGNRLWTRVVGTTLAAGKNGHRACCNEAPVVEPAGILLMPQWCFPARRQQGGTFDSESDVAIAGAISQKLKTTSKSKAGARRTVSW